jgi:hypothetical protein
MKMKKITEFKNFETFIKEMNENFKQKKSVVARTDGEERSRRRTKDFSDIFSWLCHDLSRLSVWCCWGIFLFSASV